MLDEGENKTLVRACKLSLQYITANKQRQINALVEAYRASVNFFIKSLWHNPGKLDKLTLARLQNTRLTERYKSNALRESLSIVSCTKKSAKELKVKPSMPVLTGSIDLDAKVVKVETGKKSFDVVLRLSTLHKNHIIDIPTKSTKVLKYWLSKPNAELVQGCSLSEYNLALWVKIPSTLKTEGKILSVDTGLNKLFVDSDGNFYGTDIKKYVNKIKRKKKGSKAIQRAYIERDNYINHVIKELPWQDIKVIGHENLKNIKRGKKGKLKKYKGFRKALAHWNVGRVLKMLGQEAEANRVRDIAVPASYTSQTCPKCSNVQKENRKGEKFLCLYCGYEADADYVGAQNILVRTIRFLSSLESLGLKRLRI